MAEKIERKLLAHYIDASFDTTGNTPKYVRLGKDLEEYNLELNPDVEVSKNIWGESTIKHNGYEPQSEVDPYYAVEGDPLYEKLEAIANGRLTGNDCLTTTVDVLVDSKGKVAWAYGRAYLRGRRHQRCADSVHHLQRRRARQGQLGHHDQGIHRAAQLRRAGIKQQAEHRAVSEGWPPFIFRRTKWKTKRP